MSFEEAAGRYAELRNQLQAGQIDFADFQAAVARITVVDPNGDWWQIDAASGEWLKWNGTAWVRPQTAKAGEDAGTAAPRREFSLTLQTQDYRTQLKPGAEDGFWVYAMLTCSDPAADCDALAGAIQFQAGGANAPWLNLSAPAPVAGAVAVYVYAAPPEPGAEPVPGGAKVIASAMLEGRHVTAEAALEILPGVEKELVPAYWMFEGEPSNRCRSRVCKGQDLAEYELIADGEDELGIAVAFVPYDAAAGEADSAALLERAAGQVRLRKVRLAGECAEKYQADYSPAATPGLFAVRVKAKRPLLDTEENRRLEVKLEIEGELPAGETLGCKLRETAVQVTIRPRLIFLKLVVVPSVRQGASEAWVYAGTAGDAPAPLDGIACQIDLAAVGSGPSLTLRGEAVQKTNSNGVAGWTFDYRGMNWRNVGEARFRVRAGVCAAGGPPAEATWVEIDVNANGQKFLADLTEAAGRLRLANPAFQARDGIFASMWPEVLLGPLNDVGALAGRARSWAEYSSAELRDRIWRFALERRFAGEIATAAAMNGIDFEKFEIAPIHVCLGFFLAGSEEPYLIDPWWEQTFHADRAVLSCDPERDRVQACVALLETVGPALLMKLGAVASAEEGADAVKRWLSGEAAGIIIPEGEAAFLESGYRFRSGRTPLSREQWLNEDGGYKEAPAGWGESFFTGPGSEVLRSGIVAPLEGW